MTPNQLPTCLDINAECDNEPCLFCNDHKCTFHCRQWRHVNTGYQNQSERDMVLELCDKEQKKLTFDSSFETDNAYNEGRLSIIKIIKAELRQAGEP